MKYDLSRYNLIIDGDILVYRATINAEHDVRLDDQFHILYSNMADAKDSFINALEALRAYEFKSFTIALSHERNWRKDIFPDYKGNRANLRKPLAFPEFRDWVQSTYMALSLPFLEADDVLGIEADNPNTVIWSPDKDLKQIPGMHWDAAKITQIYPHEGYRFHMYQTLVGDQADNYKGCPGIGPAKAEKLFDGLTHEELWPAVVKAYDKAGLTEADALLTARVSYILQANNYDEGDITLWMPSK